jgi:hypothetical protein
MAEGMLVVNISEAVANGPCTEEAAEVGGAMIIYGGGFVDKPDPISNRRSMAGFLITNNALWQLSRERWGSWELILTAGGYG